MEILKAPQGEFRLARYPNRKKELLRAWDAADEYLLNYFHEKITGNEKLNILIVNDSFGALTISLADHNIVVWTDSWLAEKGIQQNLIRNELSKRNKYFFIEQRPKIGDGQEYDLEIKAVANEPLNLKVDGINNFDEYEIYLVDERLKNIYNLKEENDLELRFAHQYNSFKLYIGKRHQ